MDNVSFIEVKQTDGSMATYAIIDNGNGEFISMFKSTYEEQQAKVIVE
jgi:hypothetical protein